ncbi:hypothetical protein BX616_007750 [Lobosporangium transversale]|uniref:Late embryogenesis abundant protein LEA-2 subgroup domain-containing protein n=1 Tax=Lobosporangium transversale TaxID=64571 RepID=A0A1Y2GLX1_9FUNG|nr:hypothetical protein BCR41DRAFT_386698 [Lobosporangium transversale]KAF9914701.1 hypothetical protein BX616_007750 [Lobosporangium transversale]ORZ14841.1 hypothetical protein BCR41DRAFT_386698 [Lobosporangium transversale]|eukprot:XP_021880973.1 hypothetical protein BCR41DRAFT_386698 [Lobosporangium transversale]
MENRYNSYDRGQQSYAMRDMTQQQGSYSLPYQHVYNNNNNNTSNKDYYNNDYYNQNYDETAAAPAAAPAAEPNNQPRYYNGFEDQDVKLIKPSKKRSKYLPCFPCIRTTCGRVTCCLCILLLLVIIVIVILVFAVFKMPTVDYLGPEGDPIFTFNQGNTTLGLDMVANIQVKNPNPISFNFESIVVTAYYPGYEPSIGGGNITHVEFPSKSTKTIQFPVSARYNRRQDPGFTVVQNILSRCGLLGSTNGQITINYDVKAKLKIIGITISPSLKNQSTSFACPTDIGQIASGIEGIIRKIGSFIDLN